jgi:putative glutamine amidotransferase
VRPRIAITTWKRHLPTFLGERTLLYTLADEYVALDLGEDIDTFLAWARERGPHV